MSLQRTVLCIIVSGFIFVNSGISDAATCRNWQGSDSQQISLGSNSLAPTEILTQMLEVAKQGDIRLALLKGKDAKQLCSQSSSHQPILYVDYINTLLSMIEIADSAQQAVIINEAIATCDALHARYEYNGLGNPESSYYFMLAVSQLADVTLPLSEPSFIALKQKQGKIAINLSQNPAFPADARESLASPLIEMAAAYALEDELPQVISAIEKACQLGFCEFDLLDDHPHFASVTDREKLEDLIAKREEEYLVKTKRWAAEEIQKFSPFRFNFHIDSISGGSLQLNEYQGKILVVDFWASWCAPCRQGLPHLQHLHKQYRTEGVQLLGIAMDSPDDPYESVDAIRKFLFQEGITFPCGLGTAELTNRLPGEIKYPTTLFIDRAGTVRYMATGYLDYAKVQSLTETLLNEKRPVSLIRVE